jgi:dienelactone hydrolase
VSIPSLDGKLQLPGYWFEADAPDARPAIIVLHGCSGALDARGNLDRKRVRLAELFNVEGLHMLAVDSFTPRGEKSICAMPLSRRSIQYEDRRDDVFAAVQWLARRPRVDRERIAVLGYSHGGGVVLSVLDRTERAVRAQPIQPRVAVAFYPRCGRYADMWRYEISTPLLLMIGDLDELTPADQCMRLRERIARDQRDASFELIVFPGSHHGFDAYGPPAVTPGYATRSGVATVGGNPEARSTALRRMFEFLSTHLATPLRLTHGERFAGHRFVVPPSTGFAAIDDVAAVPVTAKGHERYRQYLGHRAPKAFAITEKGSSYLSIDDAHAMSAVMESCARAGGKCWLYAVDDTIVWSADRRARIDASRLQRK